MRSKSKAKSKPKASVRGAKRPPNKIKKMYIPTAPPNYQLVRLKYSENFVFSLSSTTPMVNRLFRLNDLYDPNYSTTGHQPYFRDQMYQIYTRARVLSSKIVVQFAPNTNQPVDCIICPVSDGAIEVDYQYAREKKGSKAKILNLGNLGWLSSVMSTAKAVGVPSKAVKLDDKFIQYATGVLPADVTNWYQVGCNLMDPAGASCSVIVNVKVEMVTLFSDPVQQASS